MASDLITVYRVMHERFAESPFSGEGGLNYRSRWASKGRRVSYAAEHLALATLEKIAGVQRADLLTELVYVKAEIPRSQVIALPDESLPPNWDAVPANEGARAVGDAWLEEQQGVGLRVPSVVLPHSYNYVINSAHPEFEAMQVVEAKPLFLDNRVLRHVGAA